MAQPSWASSGFSVIAKEKMDSDALFFFTLAKVPQQKRRHRKPFSRGVGWGAPCSLANLASWMDMFGLCGVSEMGQGGKTHTTKLQNFSLIPKIPQDGRTELTSTGCPWNPKRRPWPSHTCTLRHRNIITKCKYQIRL